MITFADEKMLPQLKHIWKECFGDGDDYIKMYFDGRFKCGKCLVYICDDMVCAMLVMYNGKIVLKDGIQNAHYIYGVATLPEYRGRGISTELLKYAGDYIKSKGSTAVLAPAEPKLIEFYKKRGFAESFYIKQAEWTALESDVQIEYSSLDGSEYKCMRDSFFGSDGYFCWDEQMLDYALSENEFCGGKSHKIIFNSKSYAVLYYVNDVTLYVQESTIPDDILISLLNKIALDNKCTKISARLPLFCGISAETRPIAMSDSDKINNGYMNIIFD